MTQAALPPPGQPPRTDSLAIWALVMGILNLVCCIPFVPAILAIVLGGRHPGMDRHRAGPRGLHHRRHPRHSLRPGHNQALSALSECAAMPQASVDSAPAR